jgi:predicted HNH restriction endonuclease
MDKQPVLFVLIGWARRYDGTEPVVGAHKYLDVHARDSEEAEAFVRQDDGLFYCGAGKGRIHEEALDTVFVARHPTARSYEVVAVYREAESYVRPNQWSEKWCTVKTTDAVLFRVGQRPTCAHWPAGQGMRRWARRLHSKGASHQELLVTYRAALNYSAKSSTHATDSTDIELNAFEGELRQLFIAHRKREAKLRAAKIRQALSKNAGHLRCEVPGCGFDFLDKYGETGRNYAVVHHTKPLASLSTGGAKTSLADLAIVCPNCHAMIHRGGECKPMNSLLEAK